MGSLAFVGIMQLNPTTRATVSPYQAKALVLWRAADCGVNGVTDAVYKSKIPGARKITGGPALRLMFPAPAWPVVLVLLRPSAGQATGEKLQWLLENNLLPLAPHQAYGSLFVRSLRQHARHSA